MRLYLDAALGLFNRDWLTFSSYRTQVVSAVVGMVSGLALFYFLSKLVNVSSFASTDAYFAFVVIGMAIVQVLQSTLGVASALRNELVAGTFERMLLSPFGPVAAVVSMMIFPFIFSLFNAIVMLGLATLIFGVPVQWSTAPLAIPVALLGTGTFAAFAMLFAATTVLFKRAVGGVGLVLTIISLTSGVYFPVALLPSWLEWISSVQPFTPAVNLLRHTLVGTPLTDPWAVEIAKMVGFLVTMVPAALVVMHVAVRLGQKRGTIIEY